MAAIKRWPTKFAEITKQFEGPRQCFLAEIHLTDWFSSSISSLRKNWFHFIGNKSFFSCISPRNKHFTGNRSQHARPKESSPRKIQARIKLLNLKVWMCRAVTAVSYYWCGWNWVVAIKARAIAGFDPATNAMWDTISWSALT